MHVSCPNVYLGRQPILDHTRKIVAYELLFRSDDEGGTATIGDDALATERVIAHALRYFGIRTVVGRAMAFINVDDESLLSNMINALSPKEVVLELLETVVVDERILRRCRQLKRWGYRLALDDFFGNCEMYEPLFDIVDFVKIDVLQVDQRSLPSLVKRLRLRPLTLIAEKVESNERARQCLALGIDLFQGFLFGRPTVLNG